MVGDFIICLLAFFNIFIYFILFFYLKKKRGPQRGPEWGTKRGPKGGPEERVHALSTPFKAGFPVFAFFKDELEAGKSLKTFSQNYN